MKHEILRQMLTVLKRVRDNHGKFNLDAVIEPGTNSIYPTTETEAYECGAPACVAGWFILSPEGQALGFDPEDNNAFNDLYDTLDDEGSDAESIIMNGNAAHEFYCVEDTAYVTIDQAISKIEEFLNAK